MDGNSGSNVTHLQLADVGYHVSEERVAGNVEGNTQALRGGREGGGGRGAVLMTRTAVY